MLYIDQCQLIAIKYRMINLDTYCSHAFTSYDNRMKSVCCRAKSHIPLNSYAQSFQNKDIIQLRQDLVNGVRNPICEVCWHAENMGVESTRQDSIKYKSLQDIEKEIAEPSLKWLWLDPGNACNLACRTCFPGFSSTVGMEWSKKFPKNAKVKIIKRPDLDVIVNEDLRHIQVLMILGGEPFLDRQHHAVIEAVIKQQSRPQFNIIYVTNNTNPIPQELLKYLEDHSGVQIRIVLSIDAIDRPFEYIRTKGIWRDFVRNFDNLKSLQKIYHNLNIGANVTISLLNCLYLDPLYQWLRDNDIVKFSTCFIEGAKQYSFSVLDLAQRDRLIKHLTESGFDFSWLIKQITSDQFDPALINEFWQDVEWTESYHQLAIGDYLPDLVDLLKS